MADIKVKGRDIAELIASDRGYLTKIGDKEFNKSEWYGFKNDIGELLRIKYISTSDKKRNYNIYKNDIDKEKNTKLLAVIKINDSYHIIKINSFTKEKISLDSKMEKGNEDIEIIRDAYINDSSIYKLSNINDTIYGISQRAEDEKIDEIAIKKLFYDDNPPCSYCGITQKQINDLDNYEKENNQDYGLTIRARGKKLEVDQISPKDGYVDGNIALCCYWCNNAKTDTFSVKEFKEIARGINVAWNMKLKASGFTDTISFPENSDIWDE